MLPESIACFRAGVTIFHTHSTALVTGAAGGIGAACVHHLLQNGAAAVIAVDRPDGVLSREGEGGLDRMEGELLEQQQVRRTFSNPVPCYLDCYLLVSGSGWSPLNQGSCGSHRCPRYIMQPVYERRTVHLRPQRLEPRCTLCGSSVW